MNQLAKDMIQVGNLTGSFTDDLLQYILRSVGKKTSSPIFDNVEKEDAHLLRLIQVGGIDLLIAHLVVHMVANPESGNKLVEAIKLTEKHLNQKAITLNNLEQAHSDIEEFYNEFSEDEDTELESE